MAQGLTVETTAKFSAVSVPVRWAVPQRLSEHGTICLCDLQQPFPVAPHLLSHHHEELRFRGALPLDL